MMNNDLKKTKKSIMSYFQDFVSLIYPRTCAICGNSLFQNEEILCTPCQYHLPKTNFHLLKDNQVSRVFWGRVKIENAASFLFFTKGSKVQRLIHQFKYKGKKQIGVKIGKLYAYELKKSKLYDEIDFIVPVPLHPKKQKKRGFNQSEYFGIGLSVGMDVELKTDILFRIKASETQTKKTRFKRWENVNEIFEVRDKKQLKGKHVLLVDDVITTGATIEACAQALHKIPDIKISVVSIGVAVN